MNGRTSTMQVDISILRLLPSLSFSSALNNANGAYIALAVKTTGVTPTTMHAGKAVEVMATTTATGTPTTTTTVSSSEVETVVAATATATVTTQ
ncbi:unnamed protein product [Phytophthora fragariaefolia]|uniref:Unnamed protein product n=1 Tax=Phytophthora fragariaefolia TaxID=1490495 RepID=A0A9W6UDH5_9STRA|nr:unnamed protein product [Phytophthora fragariaefolia]